jgi:hypothetical protein
VAGEIFRRSLDLMVIWAWLGSLAALSRIPVLRRSGYVQLFGLAGCSAATHVIPVASEHDHG